MGNTAVSSSGMKNTIIYLIGYPGVGKLTVAKAACARTGARLMDNHLVNNVAFSLIEADGVTPITEGVWAEIKAIRDAALRIVAHHAPHNLSYVLTNALLDDAGDRELFDQVRNVASVRGALFVPVVLSCDEEENMRRLVAPGRAEGLKETDVPSARRRLEAEPLLRFAHPNRLDLDITELSPEQATDRIIAHAKGCTQ